MSVNVKSYVLRQGRYSDAQKRSYENLSSRYCLSRGKAALKNTYPDNNPLIAEIGFGMGYATAVLAEQNPKINYLGIEVHRPGIGKLLWEIENRNLINVRIFEGDACEILAEELDENSVSGFHIFFPDPWPKKRHHKRRLVTRPFTDTLSSCLVEKGYIYMVTDSEDYAHWAMLELNQTKGLVNPWNEGFAPPQNFKPKTKFETKALEAGRSVWEIYFIKICAP